MPYLQFGLILYNPTVWETYWEAKPFSAGPKFVSVIADAHPSAENIAPAVRIRR